MPPKSRAEVEGLAPLPDIDSDVPAEGQALEFSKEYPDAVAVRPGVPLSLITSNSNSLLTKFDFLGMREPRLSAQEREKLQVVVKSATGAG